MTCLPLSLTLGPPSKYTPSFRCNAGPIPHGSIMAFELTAAGGKPQLVGQWTSPDMMVTDSPTVANGMVFATQTGEQTLQAQRLPPGSQRPTMADQPSNTDSPISTHH